MNNKKKSLLAVIFVSAMAIGIFMPQSQSQAKTIEASPSVSETPPPTSASPRARRATKPYILTAADQTSNPYQGDTSITESHGLLCIKKANLAKPAGLPAPETTPGGALKKSWSSSYTIVVPEVQGTELTSKAVADGICDEYGQESYGVSGFQMAEFHDGDKAGWSGWGFWGDATYSARQGFEGFNDRLWVYINDQKANPWDSQGGKALTFTKADQIRLKG
jgi:hypothetical protein